MAGIWGRMPTIRILIVASAEHGRAQIQKKKQKKKHTLLIRRMQETWTGFLG